MLVDKCGTMSKKSQLQYQMQLAILTDPIALRHRITPILPSILNIEVVKLQL